MHGLIFVTWEKYLSDRFGSSFLHQYRASIGETPVTAPLVSHVYSDETLLAGVGVASTLSRFPADVLLREYGRYFIGNGLTSHLCSYLLTQVRSGRDLLLMMRKAHAQMHHAADTISPPLFQYEVLSTDPKGLVIIYDSQRHICSVLYGAIEGAAERYGEQVQIIERTCMNQGASVCRFEVRFQSLATEASFQTETAEQRARRRTQQQLANIVLSTLPYHNGLTLIELRQVLQRSQAHPSQVRLSFLLEAIHHLQHAGLVASTAQQPGDDLSNRRYWRVPLTTGK